MNGRSGARYLLPLRRRVALAVGAVMVGTLLQATGTPAAVAVEEKADPPPVSSAEKPIPITEVKVKPRTVEKGPRTPAAAPRATWPKPGAAKVDLPAASGDKARPTRAGRLPVRLSPAKSAARKTVARAQAAEVPAIRGRVAVELLGRQDSRAAGVKGPLISLQAEEAQTLRSGKAGAVAVEVDYSAFAQTYGGGYAERLTLVEMPACALTEPQRAACRTPEPVDTANDQEKKKLSAEAVPLRSGTPTVLAAVAEEAGAKGDYKATPLSPSATWSTNLNTGDFTWSHAMLVPDVPGGMKPNVGLSYSSGSIDGRTGNTNNQSSWVGDGYSLWPGYIERQYQPCADDDVENADGGKPGDQCWDHDNAFISFNGKGGELVPDGKDKWKLRGDDGTKITRLTDSDRANGDNNNEYWELTTPDGTRYYFGYHRLEGWSDGKETTNSTWTVPVYGNDAGEPCHASSFADSWCRQAWRWNLDYAVDPRGNAIAYYYGKEQNSYGRNLKPEDDTSYSRGGYLKRIDYGLRSSKVYEDKALARVSFTNAERCLPTTGVTCEPGTIDDDAFHWYDTPWDLNCKAGTECDDGRVAPTFWTRKRLTGITTHVLDGNAYSKVDSWKLTHRWGTADTDYQLLLDSLQHTGHTADPAVTLPKTTFAYTQLGNRLDKTGDGYAPFIKARLSSVADEAGGQIDVNYSAPTCDWDELPTPQTNTTRCFPQYMGGTSSVDPERHWFNKYVVTSVTRTDRTGGTPDQVTAYEYKGGAAWHYDDDNGLTKEKFKTWSQWRGYGHVRVRTGGQGGAEAMRTQQDTYFLRGMHGDREKPSGGTKTVTVGLGEGEGDPMTDHEAHAGSVYKTADYSGPDGKILSKTVNRPWHHETARSERDWGTITANFTGASHTKSWTSLDDGAGSKWRTTSTATKYDTVAGRAVEVDDRADTTTAADNRCTRTTYTPDGGKNFLTLAARVETVATACDAATDRSTDVISDVRTAYDGKAYGSAPTKGDVTSTATLKKHDGTTATYLESSATHDVYGRQLTSTDLTATVTVSGTDTPVRAARTDGRTTTTAYSPATGFPAEVTATTPPLKKGDTSTAMASTAELEPLRGKPVAEEDTNGKRTVFAYDALGRTTKIWLPNRRTSQTPNHEYTYSITGRDAIAIGAKKLNNEGGQITAYTLYDGFQRARQTQEPGPGGGRLLTDTFYDERGLVTKAFAPYYAEGAPAPRLSAPEDALSVQTQTRTTYDGLGRQTENRQIAGNGDGGGVLAVTKTMYGGDRTTVVPPEGGSASTTLSDARGQVTELRQHHTRSPGAPYDSTSYAYTPAGQLAKVTDPSGNIWTYTYDQLGRTVKAKDPDAGTSSRTYDDRGQLITTTDARGTTLTRTYDGLGRQTALHKGGTDGELLADWTFDTITGAKGQLAQSTRYADGQAYTSKVTMYDHLYRAMRTAVVIPESEGELAGTYQTGTAYKLSGLVGGVSYSAAGSLPGGSYNYTYESDTLRPVAVFGSGIRADVTLSLTGKPLQYQLGKSSSGKKTLVTNEYEWGTQRLATTRVDREEINGVDRFETFGYDEIGNVTSLSDVSRSGTDTQCFTYDHLRRLRQAWTEGGKTCASEPAAERIGGPAPYWDSYTYDKAGNRLTETQHHLSGDADRDTRKTYTYPEPGTPQPHTLTSVDTSGPTGTSKNSYTYDKAGNTATRTLGGDTQNLTWDAEGHLAKVTEPVEGQDDEVTEYLYDTSGNRLIGRTPTETTLYLGHTEITVVKGAAKARATRYIPLGGGHTAIQDDDGSFDITVADHHGTGQLAVDADDLSLTQRRTKPFGALRGEAPGPWPGTKGFVGGTDDTSTGLTHLGAREYDPATGRFISVDPVMDLADPQQIHGYAYANNNPLTGSDPSGLYCDGCSANNPDSVYNPNGKNWGGIGCTNENCYDRKGNITHPISSGGNSGGGGQGGSSTGILIQKSGDTIIVEGMRVPTYEELQRMFPVENSHQERIQAWAQRECREPADQGAFCDAAEQFGWVSFETHGDVLEVLGIRDAIDCVAKGDGGACAWVVVDVVGSVATAGIGKAFTSTGRLVKAGKRTPPPCHSFVPGTQVLLADGTRKDIEDVKVGEKIVVTDPETGETTTREVVGTITTEDDKNFVDLTITNGDREASLISTTTHPFWVEDSRRWVEAGDLSAGMRLRLADGKTTSLSAVRSFVKRQRTHDLTVNDIHTYYVLAGEAPILVHNATPGQKCDLTLGAGPNARDGVALENGDIEADGVRDLINESGNAYGCHTCDATTPGTRDGDWIPDHQPPSSLVAPGSPQTAYPHCLPCARRQGGVVSQLSQGKSKKEW
ncbi:polymorphic toxin-type HINT domain-containing protein [Streptomyces xinghaiensis]|uniref:polymorphic toxin-type HINT domain-containing protein n=1 Tax=Streptomyces xinghaiensis TaxID=1038928 RepID=UPI00379E7A54